MEINYFISIILLIAVVAAMLFLLSWIYFRGADYLDKVFKSPLKQIGGLGLLLAFLFIFLMNLHNVLFFDDGNSGYVLYGILSQTASIDLKEPDNGLKIFYFITSIIGAVFFSGALVSTVTNSLLRRLSEVENGKVRYSSLRNHDLIIGVNDTIISTIKSLCGPNKIVIVTGKNCSDVLETIQSQLDASISKRVILYRESIMDKLFVSQLCLHNCRSLIILGDDEVPENNDAKNITILDLIQKDLERSKIKNMALKCYVSYVNEDMILNYCRNHTCESMRIIPYSFYRLWAEKIWGDGHLYKKIPKVNPSAKGSDVHDAFHYKSLVPDDLNFSLHLVFLGFGVMAAELLRTAIRIAHYDKYDESKGSNKVKITIFPDYDSTTVVSPMDNKAVARFLMKYRIENLVDIDVTFERESMLSNECRSKIEEYAKASNQSLYLAICSDSTSDNILLSNHLFPCVDKGNIPVVVYSDYFMPFMEPLDNRGLPKKNIHFFGFKNKSLNVSALFRIAQAYDYLLNGDTDLPDLPKRADNYWYRSQYDQPKQILLATIASLYNIIDSLGLEICSDADVLSISDILDKERFIRILHRVHLASYVLSGYRYSPVGNNYEMKELSFLCPLSKINGQQRKITEEKLYKKFRAISEWFRLNKLGLRIRDMKDDIPHLNSKNIFVCLSDNRYLLYAPLAGASAYVNVDEVKQLEKLASKGKADESLSVLCNMDSKIELSKPLESIPELTLLLNQVCNFSCSYCYSANGREKDVLEDSLLITAVDSFVNAERGKELQIVFSGGGDPILSFDKFKLAVNHALDRALQQHVKLHIGVVTNGSTLKAEYIDFIKSKKIDLVVSFDILKEIHNRQRSHYDVVVNTIDELCSNDVAFGLRSTITPLNVDRMDEMVEELHQRFPKIKEAAFEVVLNKELFKNAEDLMNFYQAFANRIFKAQRLGSKYGITIGNTIINNVNVCKERSCLGKLVVTPTGKITACSRISSNKERHYGDFCYGFVAPDGFVYDNHKYAEIMDNNVNKHGKCKSCIAKWHCSGGCMLAGLSYTSDYMDAYCRFMQRMVVGTIEEKLKDGEDGLVEA